MSTPSPAGGPVSPHVIEIERALNRIAYLTSRVRQHDRLMARAGVPLDRAAVALLRQIADFAPLRAGALAAMLAVEASHVTRQVQRLEKSGHLTRVPDPDDGRAQLIDLTPAGRDAVTRIRAAGCEGMQVALAGWETDDLAHLAGLFHRMVDDFIARADEDDAAAPHDG